MSPFLISHIFLPPFFTFFLFHLIPFHFYLFLLLQAYLHDGHARGVRGAQVVPSSWSPDGDLVQWPAVRDLRGALHGWVGGVVEGGNKRFLFSLVSPSVRLLASFLWLSSFNIPFFYIPIINSFIFYFSLIHLFLISALSTIFFFSFFMFLISFSPFVYRLFHFSSSPPFVYFFLSFIPLLISHI